MNCTKIHQLARRYIGKAQSVSQRGAQEMVLLDNDGFLTGLTKLFQQTRGSGSVFLTMKKYNGRTKPHPKPLKTKRGKKGATATTSSLQPSATSPASSSSAAAKRMSPEPTEHLCLLRAGNGKRHISTVVSVKEVTRFQMAYANVLKANVDGLKKREKKTAGGGSGGTRGKTAVTSPRKSKTKASTH